MGTNANQYPTLSQDFQRTRLVNWLALGLLYAFFYTTRYNWSVVSPTIADMMGWKNTQLGVFETVLPLFYGISVIFNGPVADRIGGKRAFLIGAGGVVVMNVLFGCAALLIAAPAVWQGAGMTKTVLTPAVLRYGFTPAGLLSMMAVVWGLNGYFQSFGALSIVKVNAQWFHVRERGTFAGWFGVLIRFGLLMANFGVPWIIKFLPWQYAFWIPAVFVALFFLINLMWMHDSPKQAGVGDFDTGDPEHGTDDRPASVGSVLARVFGSRVTLTMALASMMIGFVRRSVVDAWWQKYLVDFHGIAKNSFATNGPYQLVTWGGMVAGILGGIAFGMSSDRRFGGRRAPVIAMGFIGMAVLLGVFGLSDHYKLGPYAAATCLVLLTFCVNGAHGIIGGAASMDFGGKKAAATAAGLFDGIQYIAGGFVGGAVGYITTKWGWGPWHYAPIPFAILGAILMGTLWNVTPSRKAGH